MTGYLISFDLITDETESRSDAYSAAEDYLRSLEGYIKPLNNTYLVHGHGITAATIRDALKRHLGREDNILVVRVDSEFASYNTPSINEELARFFK